MAAIKAHVKPPKRNSWIDERDFRDNSRWPCPSGSWTALLRKPIHTIFDEADSALSVFGSMSDYHQKVGKAV